MSLGVLFVDLKHDNCGGLCRDVANYLIINKPAIVCLHGCRQDKRRRHDDGGGGAFMQFGKSISVGNTAAWITQHVNRFENKECYSFYWNTIGDGGGGGDTGFEIGVATLVLMTRVIIHSMRDGPLGFTWIDMLWCDKLMRVVNMYDNAHIAALHQNCQECANAILIVGPHTPLDGTVASKDGRLAYSPKTFSLQCVRSLSIPSVYLYLLDRT